MAAYDPEYWNRQFRNDPEMQRIHAAEVARDQQSRADARASGRGGRRGLGGFSESDKEIAATARARAMGWAPPDHDWSVDFTDDGFRTEKAGYFTRNRNWIVPAAMAGVGGVAAWPALFGGGAAAAGGTAAGGAASGAPLLASSSPYLTAATTTVPSAITSAGVSTGIGTGIGLGGGGLAGLTAAPVAPAGYSGGGGSAVGFGRKALKFAGSDTASAIGKVGAWGFDRWGQKKQDEVLADDKAAADARYQDMLDLMATQRTEDMALDAERETRLQARWQAEQDQIQASWDAREAQMEPYRAAGQQSLARVANLQTPTRTPYRSRFMG
mgnify:CR=1 FL=1